MNGRHLVLALAAAAVWSAALAVAGARRHLAAKKGVTLVVATEPARVRITVDQERLFGGAYVATPVRIDVAPGRHRVKIARDGYVAQVTTVEGASSRDVPMDVVLQRSPDLRFGRLEVTSIRAGTERTPPVHVEIDGGHEAGETPLVAEDLSAGEPHELAAYPAWPSPTPKVTCTFTLAVAEGPDAAPLKIRVTPRTGKLQGCP